MHVEEKERRPSVTLSATGEAIGERELELAFDSCETQENREWAEKLGGLTQEQYYFLRHHLGYWRTWFVTWSVGSTDHCRFPEYVELPHTKGTIRMIDIRAAEECFCLYNGNTFSFAGTADYYDMLSGSLHRFGCHFLPERVDGDTVQHRMIVCLFDPSVRQIFIDLATTLFNRVLGKKISRF